ncbi:amidohydrolase [Chloroflexota bacterium]
MANNGYADLIIIGGNVITVDPLKPKVEAVAVKFGRILAVGSKEQIISLTGSETKVIDLKGRTAIPGMIESHCHISTADGLQRAMGVIDASYEEGVRSLADILAKIAEQTQRKPKGEWINVAKEDESKLVEKTHPYKWNLDKVAPEHPVLITTVGGHFSIANSKAFEVAGVTKDTPDPPGGRFERDLTTGELTGWTHERAVQILQPIKYGRDPTLEEATEGIAWMARQYAASGITCAYDGMVMQEVMIRAYQELLKRGELPLRIRLDIFHELMPPLTKLGIIQGFGSDMLKIGGIKIVGDGAISARTAAVAEPYLHRPDYYGELAITKEELRQIIMEGYPKGYRFCVHVNGERAINMFLDAIEEAQEKFARQDPRNRAIHCTIVTPEIISRIKKLGVLPTIFGPYPYYHGDKLIPAFGAERLERMFAARSFLDAEIKVSAHSDHNAAPYPPLMGIHALVNRKSVNGQPVGMSQKISVMEALELYTINAAYHTFEEDVLGSIEVGKLADIVVLDEDLTKVDPERIKDIPVRATMVGGEFVYNSMS